VLFRWRRIIVYSYPALLYLGLVSGVVAGNYAANLTGMDSLRVFVATLILIVPALVGARLLYVAAHWDAYRRAPRRIWRRSEGGAAMYGGLPLAVVVSVPLLRRLGVPLGAFWDVATFTILVGMVFTRIGCLLNGCCAGRPTERWCALYLPDHRGRWARRIPTQLLEATWATLLLAGAAAIWHRLPFQGALFLFVLAGYGGGRLVLESTRGQQDRTTWGITVDHAISGGLVIFGLLMLLVAWPG
jgi:prolipoprotein diacylglyceryltransferase